MALKKSGRGQAGRLISGDRRRALVDKFARILKRGEPTRFRFEATLRHSLRHDLMARHPEGSWACADAEAAAVVGEALRKIGLAHRPRADDDGFDRREGCRHCGKRLAENHYERGFCSFACAITAEEFGAAGDHLWGVVAEAAYQDRQRRVSTDRYGQRKCDECGALFTANYPQQRCCSSKCAADREKRLLPERTCVGPLCRARFKPTRQHQKWCSRSCTDRHRKAAGKLSAPRSCTVCGDDIPPGRRGDSHYCSPRCKRVAENRAKRERRAARQQATSRSEARPRKAVARLVLNRAVEATESRAAQAPATLRFMPSASNGR